MAAIRAAPRPPKVDAVAPIKVDTAVVEARDAAILAAIRRHGGMVMAHHLRKELPTDDPARRNDVDADQAIKNALLRLKAKQQVARTGDT